MKTKLWGLLAIGIALGVIAGSVKAQPAAPPFQVLGPRSEPKIAPGNSVNHEQLVAPAAITTTRRFAPASLTKKGGRDQHTGQAATPKDRLNQVYGETDPGSTQTAVYIIQLEDPALATYQGGLPNLPATSPKATGASRLDVRSAPSVAYRSYLATKQADFRRAAENRLGRAIEVIYQYDVTFNGLALKLTPQEAAKLLDVAGVLSIQRDQWRYPQTGDSPAFLGVTGIWDGSAGVGTTKGEGIIVGVIDSGIWPEHPSFADDGSYPAPPAKWDGTCQAPADGSLGYTCNNKLIGVQYFLAGYASGGGYDGLFFSGRDDDGHGTHTASTAAGNQNTPVALYGINRGTISGMAPRAHVAAYKGLGPQGGVTSDLVAAIDTAVADGVDVINYSVGSDFAGDPWIDADSLAYLAARDAGVFVATSAGNAGPGVSTIGSPANAPWVTTVGASYLNRLYLSDITMTVTSTVVMTAYGTTATPGATNFRLVDAEGIADITGDSSGDCLNPFPPGSFLPTDAVLCPRGGVATWMKGNFVNAGGAGAIIIFNSADNFDYMSYLHAIPAVYILRQDGLAIKAYLAANPGQTVRVSFTQGERVLDPDPRIPTDLVSGFSSRGPNINESESKLINVIKPDVTAPGMNILAGASPQFITVDGGYAGPFGKQGELFQLIQGTSMSSPHIAGLGALVKALHPDWSPAEIQSALMTTAFNQNLEARFSETSDLPATPFDLGSGRAVIAGAVAAGFVLDETTTNYLDVDPFFGGDPAVLNIPSLTQAECLASCTWTRTISSTNNAAVTWNVTTTGPATLTLVVTPTNFALPAKGTQVISITANVGGLPAGQWLFGEVILTPSSGAIPTAHFPLAVKPVAGLAPFTQVNIETRRDQGQRTISGLKSVATGSLTKAIYVGVPNFIADSATEDPTNGDPYDDLDDVFYTIVNVPAGTKRFVTEITDSTAPDLDLYVGLDLNGNDQPDPDEELCASTSGSSAEICNFPAPGEPLVPGDYWVLVQNWAGSGLPIDDFVLSTVVVSGTPSGLMSVSGPTSVSTNQPFDLLVGWNVPGFQPGDNLYGVIEVGTSPGNPTNVAVIPVTLSRLEDDVTKAVNVADYAVPGETLDFTLSIVPEPVTLDPVQYRITDTLPAGLTYVPGSATIAPTSISGNQLVWVIDVSQGLHYNMSTSQDDPFCDTGFGGYVNLADFGILARSTITGNNVTYNFDDFYGGTVPVNFFGVDYPDGLNITDNGFVTLASPPVNSGSNTDIPNPATPNNLIAPFWRDLAIVYNAAANRGVSLAGIGDELMLVEYDDVEPAPAGSTSNRYDFEVVMLRQIDDTPGFYEIVLAYDNINGPTTPGTIGLENAGGTIGNKYAFNDAGSLEDLMICFEATNQLDIDYQVTVDPNLTQGTTLTNTVVHTINAPGTGLGQTSLPVEIAGVIFEITMTGPSTASKGPLNYTLTVTNNGVQLATNVVITSPVPPGTSYLSGGSHNNGIVTWNVGNLGARSQTSVSLIVTPTQLVVPPTDPMPGGLLGGLDDRIVGGIEADPGAWPWQAAIMFADISNGYFAQYCGGSILTEDWILTAAHCADFVSPSDIDVAVGRHTLSSNQGQRIPVAQILVHPDYTPNLDPPDYDIALLRLAQPIVFTGTAGQPGAVGPIGLLTPEDAALATPNILAMVTGWGDRTDGLGDYADDLHQVSVPIVSNQVCQAAAEDLGFPPGTITDNIVCAGFVEGGKDACYGDSGGPLIVPDGSGWRQVGIVSSGLLGCAVPEAYGTYTRLTTLINWLQQGLNTYEAGDCYVSDGTGLPGHIAFCEEPVVTVVGLFEFRYLPLISKNDSTAATGQGGATAVSK